MARPKNQIEFIIPRKRLVTNFKLEDLARPVNSQFATYCAPWVVANRSTLVKQKGPSTHAKKNTSAIQNIFILAKVG